MSQTEPKPKDVTQDNNKKEKLLNNIALLKDLCASNAAYFSKDSSENGQRLYISFSAIIDTLDGLQPLVTDVEEKAKEYDFDEATPGNGYRSYITVFHCAVKHALDLNQKTMLRRSSLLFRKSVLTKDIESCSHILASLEVSFKHLQTIMSWTEGSGNLFAENRPLGDIISICQDINQYCFYGRSLGFQFCHSLKNVLQFIALTMAIFSEAYYSEGSLLSKATTSVMSSTRYLTDPELRAKRIVHITQSANVDFCKAFWFLSENELMRQLPSVISAAVAVCKIIIIAPEPFTLNVGGKDIEIPVPTSCIGAKPIPVRLISFQAREDMLGTKDCKSPLEPPSKGLIIHCHGGGFVAQSSKSHETYLREWAKRLNVPILSIDYSLSPEAPFPRALEEVYYAYCWALKNHHFLGSTGEKIIAVGDSAGANLILAVTLMCIHNYVPTPHGIFVAYAPTLVKIVASPARLLSTMDPLLPLGFLTRCLKAYACPLHSTGLNCDFFNYDSGSFEEISKSDLDELQAHISPISEPSDTLTDGSLTTSTEELQRELEASVLIENNEKYMADIIRNYALDTETEDTKTSQFDAESSSSSTADNSFQTKVYGFISTIKGHFSKMLGDRILNSHKDMLDTPRPDKLWENICLVVPDDSYMSPYYAQDVDLMEFPPTKILTVQLDPCLDDCIMFAKRLKAVDKNVTLDILEGLPHGFLNFSLISKDAHEGSKICVQRIKELLELDEDRTRPK